MDDSGAGADAAAAARSRITDAVFALDRDWKFTYVDDRAREAFDLGDREVVGRSIWLLLPELAGSAFQDRAVEAMDRGEPLRVDRAIPAAGTQFSMRLYPSETGITVCARAVDADEAAANDRLPQTVAETVTDAVLTIDADNVIRRANSATEEVFGYEPSTLIGEQLSVLMPEEHAAGHRAAVDRYLETGERTIDWREVKLPGVRADGKRIDLSISISTHVTGGERRFTGVVRDVTERNRRERALREAHDVITDTDRTFDEQVEALLGICRDAVGTEYATLSQVGGEEYLFDTVLAPADAGMQSGDSIPLSETNCERVVETGETLVLDDIAETAPDLASREGNVETGATCYLGTPVDVDDRIRGTFCFYGSGSRPEQFTDWQVAFVEHIASWIGKGFERQRYVDRLTALNELNQVVRAVTDEAVSQPTRAEIERRTCEAIAATDSYLFAWIGEADPGDQTVDARAEAGVEGYSEGVSISVDPDDPESDGPTGRAFRTGEVQTLRNVTSDPSYQPWHESANDYGYRSSAAVPITHEGTVYGVLNLYTDRPNAFTGEEYDVVGLLGKIVGHAIAAVGRKQVLLADSVVDLEFRISNAFDDERAREEGVKIDAVVPREAGEYVVFGTTDEDGLATVEALIDRDPSWEELLVVRETESGISFEVLVADPQLLSAINAAGGRLVEATIRNGDLRMRVQLPNDADAREVLDAVRERHDETTLVSKQAVTTAETDAHSGTAISIDELTERRLEVLRTAYYAGYFEWPRESSGEEVADLLGIAAPTFSQHLRAAEQSVLDMLFEGQDEP